jgi:hypothetical protein
MGAAIPLAGAFEDGFATASDKAGSLTTLLSEIQQTASRENFVADVGTAVADPS